jgi:hypothetical protein
MSSQRLHRGAVRRDCPLPQETREFLFGRKHIILLLELFLPVRLLTGGTEEKDTPDTLVSGDAGTMPIFILHALLVSSSMNFMHHSQAILRKFFLKRTALASCGENDEGLIDITGLL